MNIKVKQIASYCGHSISANGSVNLNLKAAYSELTNSIKLSQMLNNDVVIKVKMPNEKPMKLGTFRIKLLKIDGDGESVVKFNGLNDYIELDNLNCLATGEAFQVVYEADIEKENEDE